MLSREAKASSGRSETEAEILARRGSREESWHPPASMARRRVRNVNMPVRMLMYLFSLHVFR